MIRPLIERYDRFTEKQLPDFKEVLDKINEIIDYLNEEKNENN